jgi:PRC-barrel domain protein
VNDIQGRNEAMNKFIIASAAAALMLGISGSAFAAMSAADCQTTFQTADLNKDGSLQVDEAKVFLDAMNQAQLRPKDASLVTQDEFLTACQKDAFANIDPATIGAGQSTASTTTEQPAASTESASGEQTTTATTETTDQSATQPSTTDQTASTTEPTTLDQAAEQPAEQALAAPEGVMVSSFIGASVYSGSDENLGEVKDVVLPDSSGQAQVIIDAGDKDVAVDLAQLKIAATSDGLKVLLNATKADLESLPEFKKQ